MPIKAGTSPTTQKLKKKGGKGFFSHIPGSKIASQTVKDVGQVAKSIPGGLYAAGKATSGDIRHNVGDAFRPSDPLSRKRKSATRAMLEESVKQTTTDFRHPLRHPGYTLLDALGLASVPFTGGVGAGVTGGIRATAAAGRLGRVGRVAKLSKDMREAAVTNLRYGVPVKDTAKAFKVSPKELERANKIIGPALDKRIHSNLNPKSKKFEALNAEVDQAHRVLEGSFKQGFKEARAKAKGPQTRTLRYIPKTEKEAQILGSKRSYHGKDAYTKPAYVEAKVEVPASRQATTRAAQTLFDKARTRSPKRQFKKVASAKAYEKDIIDRFNAPTSLGVVGSVKQIKKGGLSEGPMGAMRGAGTEGGRKVGKIAKESMREANSAIRALRLYRAGYVPPNWLGAQGTNLVQMGAKYPKMVKIQHTLRKTDPEAAAIYDKAAGETMGQAMMDVGTKPGEASFTGPISTFIRGVGTSLGKVTDRASRARAIQHEVMRHGIPEDMLGQLAKDAAKGDPLAQKIMVQATMRGEPASIKFTRSGPLKGMPEGGAAKIDRALAENIFLYKWITGSSRYSGRMLGEHPTLSAALAQQGRQAPDISEVLPEHPSFMDAYIPTGGERGGLPLVGNPQAASLFDMPGTIAQQISRTIKYDPLYAAEQLNPVPHFGVTAATGKDMFRGQEISDAKKGLLGNLHFAADVELRSTPYQKGIEGLLGKRAGQERLEPLTARDAFMQFMLGGLYPTPRNPEVSKRMAKQERATFERGKGPKKKSHRRHKSKKF